MSAVREQPRRLHRFTVEDYHAMVPAGILREDARVELIDGEIIEMPPIGSPHGGRVNRLSRLLVTAVQGRAVVSPQNPVVLGRHSEPQPDLALLRWRDDEYTDSNPGPADVLLLIEVSDTTLAYDRRVKVPLYARHGIPEVWLIDVGHRRALRFADPDPAAGNYRLETQLDADRPVPLPGLPDCLIALALVL